MFTSNTDNILAFRQMLMDRQQDYILTGHSSDNLQEFAFLGRLQNKTIIWNTRLHTLHSIANADCSDNFQQFIHIQPEADNYLLTIGLYLKKIDTAAIKRTIIMIRNYKNLNIGLHKYGPLYDIRGRDA